MKGVQTTCQIIDSLVVLGFRKGVAGLKKRVTG